MKKLVSIIMIILVVFALPALAVTDPAPIVSARGLTVYDEYQLDQPHEDPGYTYMALAVTPDGSAIVWHTGATAYTAMDLMDMLSDDHNPRALLGVFADACAACPDFDLYAYRGDAGILAYTGSLSARQRFESKNAGVQIDYYPTLAEFAAAVRAR